MTKRVVDPKVLLAREWSEASLQNAIVEVATMLGFLVYHTHDSRRSQAGELDLHLVSRTVPSRDIHSELKGYDSRGHLGQLSAEQWEWLYWLQQGDGEAYLWTPEDWLENHIIAILKGEETT